MNMREYLSDFMTDAIFFDGFDEALIGHGERCNLSVVLYDAHKCIKILMNESMTEEEAVDFFEFNIVGSYVGENTPIFCYLEDGELDDAIIGYGERCDLSVVLYCANRYVDILVSEGMKQDEAKEYFELNILGNCTGENTPMFCYLIDTSQI